MLGFIGFIAAALVFGLYAFSVDTRPIAKLRLRSFKLAFLLLSIACLGWAVGVVSDNQSVLNATVVLGNALILAATVALVDSVVPDKHRWNFIAPLCVLALALVGMRAMYFAPAPFISDGVLVFNTQTEVAIVLTLLFTGVWLPVSLYVSRKLADSIRLLPLQSITSFTFIIATLSVAVFLAARRPSTLILSFGVLCLSFASLTGVNYLKRKEAK